MIYEEQYNFCFPNRNLWQELVEAQDAKDGQAISHIVAAQKAEIGDGARQVIAVDPDIMLTDSPDLDLLGEDQEPLDHTGLGDYESEIDLVVTLSELRDVPLDELPVHLPESLRKVSWFLRNTTVPARAEGQFFGHTPASHDWLYRGNAPHETIAYHGRSEHIISGRSFCELVHKDNPLVYASHVIADLESLGIERRNCLGMEDTDGLGRFASGGVPFILGGVGEVLRRVGLISFREKWLKLVKRPAQYLADLGKFLASAYPELHPEHPSRNAMHYIAYAAINGYLKFVYNKHAVLPTRQTVEYELDLARDNFGDGRCWPGVHTRLDHAPYSKRAEQLGVRVAKQHLGVAA